MVDTVRPLWQAPPVMAVDEKTMFEIYRETDYNRAFHYIFYTELEEHGREKAISKAAAGETVYSGFLSDEHREAARGVIETIVDELNDMLAQERQAAANLRLSVDQLTAERDTVTGERDQLEAQLQSALAERDQLRSTLATTADERDTLRDRLAERMTPAMIEEARAASAVNP